MPVAFTPAFTVTQLSDGSAYTITDTSDYASFGGKSNFTNRTLTIEFFDGTTQSYTPTPFSFANYPSDTLEIDNQTVDYCLRITLAVSEISPANDFSTTEIVLLPNNMLNFLYGLSQQIQADPTVLEIPNYWQNLMAAYGNYNMAKTAAFYQDQGSSQAAINRFNNIVNNASTLFQ